MTIKQLTIFLENRTGRINEVAKILGAAGINMKAFSMAETADFGLLRLIVSDVEHAVRVLHDASFAVKLTDVVCINVPNHPGALSGILDSLASNDIFIEYMYAFSEGDSANIVIRPTSIDNCVDVLQNCNCTLLQTV
jgi:hypothetical protein